MKRQLTSEQPNYRRALDNDVRQALSKELLVRFRPDASSEVKYTFDPVDVFLSCFREATSELDQPSDEPTHSSRLLYFAHAFETLAGLGETEISANSARLVAAALYYLSGFSSSSYLLSSISSETGVFSEVELFLLRFLKRHRQTLLAEEVLQDGVPPRPRIHQLCSELQDSLARYLKRGETLPRQTFLPISLELESAAFETGLPTVFTAATLLRHVLNYFSNVSVWSLLQEYGGATVQKWRPYVLVQLQQNPPILDFWPSQRAAIEAGLLNTRESLVLKMPTSAGKTKTAELAIVSDVIRNSDAKSLVLAPFRALANEIEQTLGSTLSKLDLVTISLYGGAESNELEQRVAELADVTIATPEKFDILTRADASFAEKFSTVVLDEGHLVDSLQRGASYELLLTRIKQSLGNRQRRLFLSAVIPNISDIAYWVADSDDALVSIQWKPTRLLLGLLRWSGQPTARIDFFERTQGVLDSGGTRSAQEFFVPRVLRTESWTTVNPRTKRKKTYHFPTKDKKSTAAAVALTFLKEGSVAVFAGQPRWADSIANALLDFLESGHATFSPLDFSKVVAVRELQGYAESLVGPDATISRSLKFGFAVHHGHIPQPLRLAVEDAFRAGHLRLVVCTPTLAQGVNLPIKTLIIHSVSVGAEPIAVRDFWNLIGRTGRALKETEGTAILLADDLDPRVLRHLLNPANAEPIHPFLLRLVEFLVQTRLPLSARLLSQLDDENRAIAEKVLNDLDMELLPMLCEEQTTEQLLESVKTFSRQTLSHILASTDDLKSKLEELFQWRAASIISDTPTVQMRRRFAKSGVGYGSSRGLTEIAKNELEMLVAIEAPFEQDFLSWLIDVSKGTFEGRDLKEPADEIAQVVQWWISGQTYSQVFRSGMTWLDSIDRTISYIEDRIVGRLTWITGALLRIAEDTAEENDLRLSRQLRLLPQFIRYGVPHESAVWIMSTGIYDRRLAMSLGQQYTSERLERSQSFDGLISWMLGNQERIADDITDGWPEVFVGQFARVCERYSKFRDLLLRRNLGGS